MPLAPLQRKASSPRPERKLPRRIAPLREAPSRAEPLPAPPRSEVEQFLQHLQCAYPGDCELG
jgi:hypothetical protein